MRLMQCRAPILKRPRLEDVGDAANFAEEFGVGDITSLTRLISLVDDSSLHGRSSDRDVSETRER